MCAHNTLEESDHTDIVHVDAAVPTTNIQTVSSSSTVTFDQEMGEGYGLPTLGNDRNSPAATATVVGGSDVSMASRPSDNGGLSLDVLLAGSTP